MVKNLYDEVYCSKASLRDGDRAKGILCDRTKTACVHIKFCGIVGHYILKSSAMSCFVRQKSSDT